MSMYGWLSGQDDCEITIKFTAKCVNCGRETNVNLDYIPVSIHQIAVQLPNGWDAVNDDDFTCSDKCFNEAHW
ncbi:hypothetical protein KC887_04435 [Candidatus Kaiserbacteria bacterium]|nr:hypothetical protein [Candidatus Kaiserbacteria bacterium]